MRIQLAFWSRCRFASGPRPFLWNDLGRASAPLQPRPPRPLPRFIHFNLGRKMPLSLLHLSLFATCDQPNVGQYGQARAKRRHSHPAAERRCRAIDVQLQICS